MNKTRNTAFDEVFPDRLIASCTREQAAQLIPWDHHSIRVGGQPGVMLTYAWMEQPLDDQQEPFVLLVVPRYADRHPPAPPEIQAIIDQRVFARSTTARND